MEFPKKLYVIRDWFSEETFGLNLQTFILDFVEEKIIGKVALYEEKETGWKSFHKLETIIERVVKFDNTTSYFFDSEEKALDKRNELIQEHINSLHEHINSLHEEISSLEEKMYSEFNRDPL